jgi:D-alanine-D-alanine ligase
MRVAILHQAVPDDAPSDELDVLGQARAIRKSLRRLGHEVHVIPVTLNLDRLRQQLSRLRIDAVFNLVESLGGSDRLIAHVPALLDVLDLPYTGVPAEAIALSTNKLLAKRLLRDAGLPTADWIELPRGESELVGSGSFLEPVAAQYIVKCIWEHGSLHLDDEAVVSPADRDQLLDLLRARKARFGREVFAERFIAGREFNVALLDGPAGPEVLPIGEIQFDGFAEDKPRIVGYQAKWSDGSFEFENTPRTFDFLSADDELLAELARWSQAAWQLFGLKGYARVDFRIDAQGQPWILEINANPCLNPDAGFAAMLERAGIPFVQAIERILDAALTGRAPQETALG